MALTPEEEKKYREEIRKRLEDREKKERSRQKSEEDEKMMLLEQRLRAQIKEEEEQKFFSDRGYVKYVNRHGEAEWLLPDEAEKRKNRRRSKKESSGKHHHRSKTRNIIINSAIVFSALALFALLNKMDFGTSPKLGSIVVKSNVAGAAIYLDGEKLENFAPDTLRHVKEGKHFVTVSRDGYAAKPPIERIFVLAGKTVNTEFILENTAILAEVVFKVNVKKYQVFVDGKPFLLDKEDRTKIPVGYHTLMVVKKGYLSHPAYKRVFVKPGVTTVVEFELYRDSEIGYLQISNNRFSGYIYVDEKFTGLQAQGTLLPIPAGTHEIQIRADGFRCLPDSQLVNILPDEKKLIVFRLEPDEKSYQMGVRSQDPGAAILVDGEWTPFVTPVTGVPVSPGAHFLNLFRDSKQYSAVDKKINISHRSKKDFYFDF